METYLPWRVAVVLNAPPTRRQTRSFQHEAASQHIHNEQTTFLNKQLPEQWIGREGSTSWPPVPPDLTPLNLPQWGAAKDEVRVPPMPVTWTIWRIKYKQRLENWSAFVTKCPARNRISSWCVQGYTQSTYWACTGYNKTFCVALYNGLLLTLHGHHFLTNTSFVIMLYTLDFQHICPLPFSVTANVMVWLPVITSPHEFKHT
jgi:hypothetical protein